MTTPHTLHVFTSRYSNPGLEEAVADGYVLARITRGAARFFKLPLVHIPLFAPTKAEFDLPTDKAGDAEFDRLYAARMTEAGTPAVVSKLLAFQGEAPGIILLCFEDVRCGELCHRTTLATWLTDHLGLNVPEWPDPSTPKTKKTAPATAATLL